MHATEPINKDKKRTREGVIIARRTDNHNYGQNRDERHSNSNRYNYDYVQMLGYIWIIKHDASHNRALDGVGKKTRV